MYRKEAIGIAFHRDPFDKGTVQSIMELTMINLCMPTEQKKFQACSVTALILRAPLVCQLKRMVSKSIDYLP